jgi:hypothetical protein
LCHPTDLSGYKESDEGDSMLFVVLDSLIPFICDKESTVKLPVFQGKSSYRSETESGEAGCSNSTDVKAGKEYAWSRGLGIELSLIKTRSARKKSTLVSTDSIFPQPTTKGRALRVMKALARSK